MADGGWWTRTGVTAALGSPRIPDRCSGSAFRLPIWGAASQTGSAPFIYEIGNGQVLVSAVCVTTTVLLL